MGKMGVVVTVVEEHATLDTANVVGPLFVANMLNWALFGVLAIQAYLFVLARSDARSQLQRQAKAGKRYSRTLPVQFPNAHTHDHRDRHNALTQRSTSSSINLTPTSVYPSPVDRFPPPVSVPVPQQQSRLSYLVSVRRQHKIISTIVFFLFSVVLLQVILATTHAFHFFVDRWGDIKRLQSSQQSWLLITAVNIIAPIVYAVVTPLLSYTLFITLLPPHTQPSHSTTHPFTLPPPIPLPFELRLHGHRPSLSWKFKPPSQCYLESQAHHNLRSSDPRRNVKRFLCSMLPFLLALAAIVVSASGLADGAKSLNDPSAPVPSPHLDVSTGIWLVGQVIVNLVIFVGLVTYHIRSGAYTLSSPSAYKSASGIALTGSDSPADISHSDSLFPRLVTVFIRLFFESGFLQLSVTIAALVLAVQDKLDGTETPAYTTAPLAPLLCLPALYSNTLLLVLSRSYTTHRSSFGIPMHTRIISDPDTETTMYEGETGMGLSSLSMPRARFDSNPEHPNIEKRLFNGLGRGDNNVNFAIGNVGGEGFRSETGDAMRGATTLGVYSSSRKTKKTLVDLTTGPGLGLPIMSIKRPKLSVPVPIVWRWSKRSSRRNSKNPEVTPLEEMQGSGYDEVLSSHGHQSQHNGGGTGNMQYQYQGRWDDMGFEGMETVEEPGMGSRISLVQNPTAVPILRPLDLDFQAQSTFGPISVTQPHSLSPETRMHLERDIIGSSSGGSLPPPPPGVQRMIGGMSRPSSTPNMRAAKGNGRLGTSSSAWTLGVAKDERSVKPQQKIQKKRSRPLGPRWGKKWAANEGGETWVDMSVLGDQVDTQPRLDGEGDAWQTPALQMLRPPSLDDDPPLTPLIPNRRPEMLHDNQYASHSFPPPIRRHKSSVSFSEQNLPSTDLSNEYIPGISTAPPGGYNYNNLTPISPDDDSVMIISPVHREPSIIEPSVFKAASVAATRASTGSQWSSYTYPKPMAFPELDEDLRLGKYPPDFNFGSPEFRFAKPKVSHVGEVEAEDDDHGAIGRSWGLGGLGRLGVGGSAPNDATRPRRTTEELVEELVQERAREDELNKRRWRVHPLKRMVAKGRLGW